MSERRETTLNASLVAPPPATKRESFDWPKYSLIVGTITTTAVKASDALGCQASPAASRSAAYFTNVPAAAWRNGGSGRTSPNSTAPSPSTSTGVPGRLSFRERAPERALGQVEEVPGLLQHGAVRQGQVEGNGALGILGGARAGVDDDVVLGEGGRSGDDALGTLVGGVPLDPGRPHLREQRAHLVRAGRPQRGEVAVLLPGEVGVLRRQLVELHGEGRKAVGVVAEESLDAGELGRGTDRFRARLRRTGALGRLVSTAATRQCEQCACRQHRPEPTDPPCVQRPLLPSVAVSDPARLQETAHSM